MQLIQEYNLEYNFSKYNDRVQNYLNQLLINSNNYFLNQYRKGKINNIEKEYHKMCEFINNIEEYLIYYINNPNFEYILNVLEKIRTVSVLPKNERGIYGKAEANNNILFINPELAGSRFLTPSERTRLYVAHELGHFINSEWMNTVVSFLDKKVRLNEMTQEEAQLFYDGCSLLDEAITQNRAEDFAYTFARKKRPNMQDETRDKLFNGDTYKANFDFYGELQEPAIMFARTLRGIGKLENDNMALRVLSERAISPDFFNKIVDEYTKDSQLENLIPLVQNMGIIKNASYCMFGYESDNSDLSRSKEALDNLKTYATNLRDYRDPLESSNEHSTR